MTGIFSLYRRVPRASQLSAMGTRRLKRFRPGTRRSSSCCHRASWRCSRWRRPAGLADLISIAGGFVVATPADLALISERTVEASG